MHVVGAMDTLESVHAAVDIERPDVVVVFDPLADRVVDRVLPQLVRSGAQVIVVSGNDSIERVAHMLDLGVSGYLTGGSTTPQEVADAVISVAGGGATLPPRVVGAVLEQWREFRSGIDHSRVSLTQREKQVLTAMADGLPTKGIARQLGVALKTVESHKIRVFDKLGARSQAHAVSIAISQNLLTPERTLGKAADGDTPTRML